MTKFNELSITNLHIIVDQINSIFDAYRLDEASKDAFWECVDIGNKKWETA